MTEEPAWSATGAPVAPPEDPRGAGARGDSCACGHAHGRFGAGQLGTPGRHAGGDRCLLRWPKLFSGSLSKCKNCDLKKRQ